MKAISKFMDGVVALSFQVLGLLLMVSAVINPREEAIISNDALFIAGSVLLIGSLQLSKLNGLEKSIAANSEKK